MKTDIEKLFNSLISEFQQINTSQENLRGAEPQLPSDVLKSLIQKRQLPDELNIRFEEELFGFGPIQSLIDDPSVTEILINSPKNIWFERFGKMILHSDTFLSDQTFNQFAHRVCEISNIHWNLKRPFADGVFLSFRVHIVAPPIAPNYIHLSLRRQAPPSWTLEGLKEMNWCNEESLNLLNQILKSRANVLVVGPTGCGKTTVINACLKQMPTHERIIVIEDTDEIKLPNSLSTKLLTRVADTDDLLSIDQNELIRQSLRMRPHRLVLGEVRGVEAKDYLMALATGHRGGICSLHAASAREALIRIEMLTQLGAPQWDIQAIRHLIRLSLDYILVLDHQEGSRCLREINRIASLEESGIICEQVSEFPKF